MTQIERISCMERILDEAAEAAENLSQALERCRALREDIAALEAYYTGPDWMRDYEDDCAGRLPEGLKRGVLSEDAVYDLLRIRDELRRMLKDENVI